MSSDDLKRAVLDHLAVPEEFRKATERRQAPSFIAEPISEITGFEPGVRGSPAEYTEEWGARILERVENGQRCEPPEFPSKFIINRWRREVPEFGAKYTEAWKASAEALEDKLIVAAENATMLDAHVAKIKIDAYKWAASKRNWRLYGDRQTLDVQGEVVHTTPEQRQARIQALQQRLGLLPKPVVVEGKIVEQEPEE